MTAGPVPTTPVAPVPPVAKRLAGLDGLRGIAALLVMAHHFIADFFYSYEGMFKVGPSWAPAGHFGVDVFFVISGYLVTTIAVGEAEAASGWWRGFYARRAARLLPALLVLCAVHLVYSELAGLSTRNEIRTLASVLTGTVNITPILFDFIPTEGLVPLWTLAIEWQFYVVLPLLLVVLRPLAPRWAAATALMWALGVMVWRTHLHREGVSLVELFTRTDTRIDGIFIGVALAFAWPAVRRLGPRTLGRLGWAGVAVFLAFYLRPEIDEAILYSVGFTTVALSAALMVSACLAGTGPARLLAARPLPALGRCSYSLYIWHSFVFTAVARYGADWPRATQGAVALVAVTAVTAASWSLVERPLNDLVRRRREVRPTAGPALHP